MTKEIEKAWTRAKGWKTLAAALAVAIIGVLQTTDWASIVPPGGVGPVMLGIAVVMAVLRVLTDGPVGKG